MIIVMTVNTHFSIGYYDMDSQYDFLANMTMGWSAINGYDDLDSPTNYQSMILKQLWPWGLAVV